MSEYPKKSRFKSKSRVDKFENIIQVVEPLAPDAVARQLVSFSVTTDSVVATAKMVFANDHTHLSLHWGDGQVEVVNLTKLRLLSKQAGDTGEPNTLTVQHVYRTPFDEGSVLVNAVTRDSSGRTSSDIVVIEIEKKFRLTFFSVLLEFPHHLDSPFESFSEIEARMYAKHDEEKIFDKRWNGDVLTNPQIVTGKPITWRLDKSGFTQDISPTDPPVKIFFELVEADGIGEEGGILNTIWDVLTFPKYIFDIIPISTNPANGQYNVENQTGIPFKIHPDDSLNTNLATAIYRSHVDHGVVFVKFNYELRLHIPLDPGVTRVMART